MQFASDPSIPQKVKKMRERVRWEHPYFAQYQIDQTQLVIDDARTGDDAFSFLVIGDSGTGRYRGDSPQRRVAENMIQNRQESRFTLHTGDVVYLVGSSEQYLENFIEPYRECLVGGEAPDQIAYDQMVFNHPILPVPGNHDYYNISRVLGLLSQLTMPVRYLLRSQLDIDLGKHGSNTGNAYARAFLDYLKGMDDATFQAHIKQHYSGSLPTGLSCLRYQPGQFTRLPNRYYRFRYGGVDFFALDSNTFNTPNPIPTGLGGKEQRRQLESRRHALNQTRSTLLESIRNQTSQLDDESLDDIYAKAEQIAEQIRDLEKQLDASAESDLDREQLSWLERSLIESWQDPTSRGRIIYFHHPPYVTEATKWNQGQTLAIRTHFRQVLDTVKQAIGPLPGDRPLVNLILNGHAHCLEYLRTQDTGHGDSHLNWIVCGGSGFSLRRQRSQGNDLCEVKKTEPSGLNGTSNVIAQSQLYVGRHGRGSHKRRPYSYLRIDVAPGDPLKLTICPFILEKRQKQWHNYSLPAFTI